jgi:hypothetical protein
MHCCALSPLSAINMIGILPHSIPGTINFSLRIENEPVGRQSGVRAPSILIPPISTESEFAQQESECQVRLISLLSNRSDFPRIS